MSSSEFEHGRPYTGEIDWTLPEFSVRDRIALRFLGYETAFLSGEYFSDMLSGEDVKALSEEYKDYNFDFANLRTMQSEVAVLRSLFLPDSDKLTNKEADVMLKDYEHNLREKMGLKNMRLKIGNAADYIAVFNWFAEQQLWVQDSPKYITTSTIDFMPKGKKCLAIMFHGLEYYEGVEVPYPKYSFKEMPLYNPNYGSRIAPIIVPT